MSRIGIDATPFRRTVARRNSIGTRTTPTTSGRRVLLRRASGVRHPTSVTAARTAVLITSLAELTPASANGRIIPVHGDATCRARREYPSACGPYGCTKEQGRFISHTHRRAGR